MGHTSIDVEDPNKLVTSIRKMINDLPLLSECCIYRVPKRLRESNEKAYTPQVVSIGPFHRKEKNLQAMEEHKLRCLKAFLGHTEVKLEDCVEKIKSWEDRARSCYVGSIDLSRDDFVKMILLDSSFIIETILGYCVSDMRDKADYLSLPQMNLDMRVRVDMILLENQLPFFVLEGLFIMAFPQDNLCLFHELSITYFEDLLMINHISLIPEDSRFYEVKHFLDLLRIYHLPSSLQSRLKGKVKIKNATVLQEAGVNFEKSSSYPALNIEYNPGVLIIPPVKVQDWTESVLRNLIALEICHYKYNSYILDYFYFINNLIDTPEDVDLLTQNGIIENWLGDNLAVASLFNNLTTETMLFGENYYFYDVSEKLNAHSTRRCPRWMVTLYRDYFSTPWRTASTIAAVILLGLTFIQTEEQIKRYTFQSRVLKFGQDTCGYM